MASRGGSRGPRRRPLEVRWVDVTHFQSVRMGLEFRLCLHSLHPCPPPLTGHLATRAGISVSRTRGGEKCGVSGGSPLPCGTACSREGILGGVGNSPGMATHLPPLRGISVTHNYHSTTGKIDVILSRMPVVAVPRGVPARRRTGSPL